MARIRSAMAALKMSGFTERRGRQMADSAPPDRPRCFWAGRDPQMIAYHDEEWGEPCRDDRELFARLVLDSFQSGLSWAVILRKREHFRRAFDGFNPERIATYGPADVERLLADAGIVRNRRKIEATIANAQAMLAVQREIGSFADYLWSFVGGQTLRHSTGYTAETLPARTPESDAMAADLRRRGFRFVGSTVCYAFMQGAGLVDDHVVGCFKFKKRET
jgi:DNA-3-methyladenine glycosylase I